MAPSAWGNVVSPDCSGVNPRQGLEIERHEEGHAGEAAKGECHRHAGVAEHALAVQPEREQRLRHPRLHHDQQHDQDDAGHARREDLRRAPALFGGL